MSDINEKTHQTKDQVKVRDLPPQTRDEDKDGSKVSPPGRSDLALKRFENLEEHPDQQREHSLQANAKERAKHPQNLNAGTPYDWEDLDAYQEELERLDKHPPKGPETP